MDCFLLFNWIILRISQENEKYIRIPDEICNLELFIAENMYYCLGFYFQIYPWYEFLIFNKFAKFFVWADVTASVADAAAAFPGTVTQARGCTRKSILWMWPWISERHHNPELSMSFTDYMSLSDLVHW